MTTDFIIGADFSTLEEVENQGGVFYENGKTVQLEKCLADNGVSSVRLRIWNDPYSSDGAEYGGGTCDIERIIRIAKRAKSQGMSVMLDFHYSDFWCDPARQGIPKAWSGKTLDEMCDELYRFTKLAVERFAAEGINPEYIQVGNEITNGMLWNVGKLNWETPAGLSEEFDRLSRLVNAGTKAVRECSDAKIIIHLERSGDNRLWREWFDNMTKRGMDFDIIGASYYPLWHGSLDNMRANFDDMITRYDKDIMIVETAYPFTAQHHNPEKKDLIFGEGFTLEDGSKPVYPFTKEGQTAFIHDLIDTSLKVKDGRCKAIYYWEPGWLPLRESTWATTSALKDIGEEEKGTGNEWANQCLFDYGGNANPAIYEFRRFKPSDTNG